MPYSRLVALAAKNLGDVVTLAIRHADDRKALVVFDDHSPLAKVITEAYRVALPRATFLDFDAAGHDGFFRELELLKAGDLVVLVQSKSFRLDEFRIRVELFQRGLATIEHSYLFRAGDDRQMALTVEALAFDREYYQKYGHALKARIDRAQKTVVRCAGTELVYDGPMEPAKLNIGDYAGMKNVGGTFPIGEVFSEPSDLSAVNGEAMLFAYADKEHLMRIVEPFKIVIEKGVLVRHEGPEDFEELMGIISAEEKVLVREFGLGLNPALGRDRVVSDITSFERQKGLHFSLGEKHGIYKKPGFNQKKTRYHVDVFVAVERIEFDGVPAYVDGEFLVDG